MGEFKRLRSVGYAQAMDDFSAAETEVDRQAQQIFSVEDGTSLAGHARFLRAVV